MQLPWGNCQLEDCQRWQRILWCSWALQDWLPTFTDVVMSYTWGTQQHTILVNFLWRCSPIFGIPIFWPICIHLCVAPNVTQHSFMRTWKLLLIGGCRSRMEKLFLEPSNAIASSVLRVYGMLQFFWPLIFFGRSKLEKTILVGRLAPHFRTQMSNGVYFGQLKVVFGHMQILLRIPW